MSTGQTLLKAGMQRAAIADAEHIVRCGIERLRHVAAST
jgi:hypothetical protein